MLLVVLIRRLLHFSAVMRCGLTLWRVVPADFRLLVGWLMGASIVYALTWPTHVLIADEVAYLTDALRWTARPSACALGEWSGYAPGTSWLGAVLLRLTGRPTAVFGVGWLGWMVGLWVLGLLLRSRQRPMEWALYPALYLPGVVLSRAFMSDVASFGLAAAFLWGVAEPRACRSRAFVAGVLGGLALLFRETNLLWVLPFMIGALWRRRPHSAWLWAGFLAGALCRGVWAKVYFGNFFYVRDPQVAFSWTYLLVNLPFYIFALTVLCPGGLFFLKNKKMPFWEETALAATAFLLVYGCYGYEAFAKSGALKGLVLQGRFMLPLLPFLAFSGAFLEKIDLRRPVLRIAVVTAAAVLWVVVQAGGYWYNRHQQKVTDALLALPTAVHWSASYDESRKYLNALHTSACLLPLPQGELPAVPAYVHVFTRSDSADWQKKNAMALSSLTHLFDRYYCQLLFDHTLPEGTRLRIWYLEARL